MHKPSDYRAIRMWGKQLLSFDYYIENLQCEALHDGAPLDAIYKATGPGDTGEGKWVTVSELHKDHPFRLQYEASEATELPPKPSV